MNIDFGGIFIFGKIFMYFAELFRTFYVCISENAKGAEK